MGKHKKPKTHHLSDAEIWDDSALIRSWDEAVAEYEYYHSIHAKGEDVEDVLRQAGLQETAPAETSAGTLNGKHVSGKDSANFEDDYEDGEFEEAGLDHAVHLDTTILPSSGEDMNASIATSDTKDIPESKHGDANMSLPSASSVNQTLENIKMAYWWAGYYSGLYDGQQRAGPQ